MNGRKGMLTIFGVFVAPFLLAAIVYKMGLFNAGVTNKGEFMDTEISLNWILPEKAQETEWIILYWMPQDCDTRCQNALYSLNQGIQALGKLQGKAHPVVIRHQPSSMSPAQLTEQYPFITIMPHSADKTATLGQLSTENIYLVDPFGKVILHYPVKADRQEAIMITKDWMADLKRLLKYSRTE